MPESADKSNKKTADSRRDVFEEFFNDYYKRRRQVYHMNLVRGIWFGFGSVLGGTLLITLLLWILSFFHQIPFLNDIIDSIQNSIEQSRR
jgi:hypothetical protein